MKLDRRLTLGELPALVREVLQRGRMGRAEQTGREEREEGEGKGHEKEENHRDVVVQKRHFGWLKTPPNKTFLRVCKEANAPVTWA